MNATPWPTLNDRLPPMHRPLRGPPESTTPRLPYQCRRHWGGKRYGRPGGFSEQVHNRTYRAVRQDRPLLGRTTDSVVWRKKCSVPRGQQKVLNRDDNRKGVSSDEPDQQADVSADLRGSRSSPRVAEDRVP